MCDGKLLAHLGVSTVEGKQVHDGCKREAMALAYPHQCPQCVGSGKVVTSWRTSKECCTGGPLNYGGFGGFAGCEYCPQLHERKEPAASKPCDLCEGRGRLKNKPVPVMTQTGWKKG